MSKLAAVFQIGSLGDSIVSLPTLLSLRDLLPDCSEYLLVSKFESAQKVLPAGVFEMAWPPKAQLNYDGASSFPAQIVSASSVLASLRRHRPKYCVYLLPANRSPRQVQRDRVFFKASGIRELIGFRSLTKSELYGNGVLPTNTEAFQRFRRIWNNQAEEKFSTYAKVPLINPGDTARKTVTNWLVQNRQFPARPLVAVCPYSNYPSKDIPEAILRETLAAITQSEDVEIVFVGGSKDRAKAAAVAAQSGGRLNSCGVFSVNETAALLEKCALALCADSGPMHLASVVGTPCIVAYSRISPQLHRWFPLGRNNTILYEDVACAGCNSVQCRVPGHPCMTQITSTQLLTAVARTFRPTPNTASLTARS